METVKKIEELYEENIGAVLDNEVAAMAKRFKVRKEDVVFAAWKIAQDTVWAKLAFDLKEKEKEEKARAKEQA